MSNCLPLYRLHDVVYLCMCVLVCNAVVGVNVIFMMG